MTKWLAESSLEMAVSGETSIITVILVTARVARVKIFIEYWLLVSPLLSFRYRYWASIFRYFDITTISISSISIFSIFWQFDIFDIDIAFFDKISKIFDIFDIDIDTIPNSSKRVARCLTNKKVMIVCRPSVSPTLCFGCWLQDYFVPFSYV